MRIVSIPVFVELPFIDILFAFYTLSASPSNGKIVLTIETSNQNTQFTMGFVELSSLKQFISKLEDLTKINTQYDYKQEGDILQHSWKPVD